MTRPSAVRRGAEHRGTIDAGSVMDAGFWRLCMSLVTRSLGLLLISTLGAPGWVGAQTADDVFVETIDVHVVNVDVYVTDKEGQPVSGLTRDDFELFEDGRPVAISNFYAVDGGQVVRPDPGSPSAAGVEPPSVSRGDLVLGELDTPTVPEDQRLHLVLYFDNLFLRPFNRNRVIREARRFLAEHTRPEDAVMVATFERTLHIRQGFTSDRQAVTEALFELEDISGFAVQATAERDRVIQSIDLANTFEAAEPHVDFYAREVFNNLSHSLTALRQIVDSLAGLPGRKAILHVSDGIPMVAGADLYHMLDLKFGEASRGNLLSMRYSARSRYRELTAAANAHRVTFYPLEAVGSRSHASVGADVRANSAGGSRIEVDITRDFNYQEPLQKMALDTGGQASFNTNNIAGALDRVGDDLRSYYSLGYAPAHGGDGRLYDLEVKLKRKGLEVRHRGKYRAKNFETRLREGLEAALQHGVSGANALDARLTIGRPSPRDDGFYLVPFTVTVPFGKIVLLPAGDQHRGRLRLLSGVVDEDGDLSPPEQANLPLDIPSTVIDQVLTQDIVYEAQLLMRPGLHRIAVGLRDDLSGQVVYVREGVQVGG